MNKLSPVAANDMQVRTALQVVVATMQLVGLALSTACDPPPKDPIVPEERRLDKEWMCRALCSKAQYGRVFDGPQKTSQRASGRYGI